ncbi:MAG: dihydroorotase [Leptolyngbya sp. SIO3F4]|nr:dihydroorotase [Leptolyngbya sp. SIO3F4]
MDSWIRGARIIDPQTQRDHVGDVLIRNFTIQAVEASLDFSGREILEIDGQGCILGPGLVDLYSQTGDPGDEARETLENFQKAAAQGGITRVGILPNTTPAIDNPAMVIRQLAHNATGKPLMLPWGAITHGTQGNQLTDLMELSATGVVGLSDGQPFKQGRVMQRLLEYMQSSSLPLALWPSDNTQAGICRDGVDAIRLGLSPLSVTAETKPLTALIEEVASSLRPVHLMRISTARSVELIRMAKERGMPITASVTWLHLLFSTADLDSYAPSLRLAPPLGTPEDREALIAGLEDGTLDAIAIDHCVYTYEEKAVPFELAPPGAVGLQLALPVLWQHFVATNRWTALQLWGYLSLNPAQCLNIEPASLQIGNAANLVLFDPTYEWLVTSETLGCDPINTPYHNQKICGHAKHIWI